MSSTLEDIESLNRRARTAFVTVLGFNLFGDGLRDALAPRLK